MNDAHWTEEADRIGTGPRFAANPFIGLLAEDEYGDLLLPSWRNRHKDISPGGWWSRRLNLWNPMHWVPWARSRITRRLVWVDACP